MTRPPKPDWPIPDGYERVVAPSPGWETVAPEDSQPCRLGRPSCKRPSVARLLRAHSGSRRGQWWHYCADHLYGRWIEDGQVVGWRLRKAAAS